MATARTGARSRRGFRKGSVVDEDAAGEREGEGEYDDGDSNWYVQVLMKPLDRGNCSLLLGWVGLSGLTPQQRNLIYGIGFVFTSVICYQLIRLDLGYIFRRLCSVVVPIFSINCAFYWLALYLRKSWSATSVYVLFSACFAGEFFGQYFVGGDADDTHSEGFITNPGLVCMVLVAASIASVFSTLETAHSAVMLLVVSFVRLLACTALVDIPPGVRPFVAYLAGVVGVIAAKYMETVFKPPNINNIVAVDGKIPPVIRRRRSSAAVAHGLTTNRAGRRTSLPALIEKNQSSAAAFEGAIIAEAHGLISDMLADSTLPLHVVSGLHAVSNLLKPVDSHNAVHKTKVSPLISLTEVTSYGSDTEDSPYTGERPSSLPKRLRRSLPQSLIRRMSASTWTTTTSATGMPTLEPEPCRTRSISFRQSCDNTPNTSPVTSRSTSPSPGSPTTIVQNTPRPRSFSVANIGPIVITPHKPSRENRSCFAALTDVSRLNPLKTDISGSPVCARTPDTETSIGDQASNTAHLGLSKRLNITSDYESSSSPSSSEHSDHVSCGDEVGGRTVGMIVRPVAADIRTAVQKIESIPHNKKDGSVAHKDDTQNRLVHNNTNPSTWAASPTSAWSAPGHKHSVNDKKRRETVGNQVSPLVDGQDGTLDVHPFDLDEVDRIDMLEMRNLAEWDYPIFTLSDVVPSTILSMVAYKIFREVGFFETFRIPLPEFLHYFHALELGYRDNPYHNRVHATDVLHGVYYFTSQAIPGLEQVNLDEDLYHKDCGGSGSDVDSCGHTSMSFVTDDCTCGIMGANFPPLELMALYTAAAMHDYDHPGRTNAFLVATHAPLAVLYNDRSVLESHHVASVWRLFLTHPEYNWLVHLDKAEFNRFRFLVIEAILATDLKQHFEILAEFNAKVAEEDATGIDWTSESDRLMVANMVIKVADINGPCKKKDLHLQWTHRISEEFYEQGDEEQGLGLPISPYMDRKHPQLAKLQESFINHLLAPLCNSIAAAGLIPGTWVDDEPDSESSSDADKGNNKDFESEPEDEDVVRIPTKRKRKVHCRMMQNLKDNHEVWVKVLKQEMEEKEREKEREATALKLLPEDMTSRPLSMDLDVMKLEMETIKEEDTPPGSVNTTRENNDSFLLSPATGGSNDKDSQSESSTSVANHVVASPPGNCSQSGAMSLSGGRSQSECNSLPSVTKSSNSSSRSQSDCHDASESPSRLSRPYLKESGV